MYHEEPAEEQAGVHSYTVRQEAMPNNAVANRGLI